MANNRADSASGIETGIDINNWIQVSTWSKLLCCDYDEILYAVSRVGNGFSQVASYINNNGRNSCS